MQRKMSGLNKNDVSISISSGATSSLTNSSHNQSSDDVLYENNKQLRPSLSFYQQARSPQAILTSMYNDFSLHLARDLVLCYAYWYLATYTAKAYLESSGALNIRPIPYQTTKAGDVLLDLQLANDLVRKPDQIFNSAKLWIISFKLPLMIMILIGAIFPLISAKIPNNNSFVNIHAGTCYILTAWGSSELFTNIFKFYVGRLRPNFYAMCGFDKETLQCANDVEMQMEARMSFPSGHSSRSFCGLLCVVLILLGRVGIARNIGSIRASARGKLLLLLSFTPLLLAFWCATSRLVDNWHHSSDIIAGTVLGSVCALIGYHIW